MKACSSVRRWLPMRMPMASPIVCPVPMASCNWARVRALENATAAWEAGSQPAVWRPVTLFRATSKSAI